SQQLQPFFRYRSGSFIGTELPCRLDKHVAACEDILRQHVFADAVEPCTAGTEHDRGNAGFTKNGRVRPETHAAYDRLKSFPSDFTRDHLWKIVAGKSRKIWRAREQEFGGCCKFRILLPKLIQDLLHLS